MRFPFLAALALTSFAACAALAQQASGSGRSESASALVEDAVQAGAVSCRFNVEDMFLHALNGRSARGAAIYPEGDEARRPFSGLYVIYQDGHPVGHLQVVAGPDASGNCSLTWTETRVLDESCSSYEKSLKPADAQGPISFSDSSYITLENGLKTLLTPVGASQCLVSETDVAWRINPDAEARGWIKSDHGYDPVTADEAGRAGSPGNG